MWFYLRQVVQLRQHGDGEQAHVEAARLLPQWEVRCWLLDQTSAGVPRNEPGSPGAGSVGFDHAVKVAT